MLKACECFLDILGHGEVDCLIGIVPKEVDTAEDFTIFVDCGVVVFLKGVDEMGGVAVSYEFDTEIIDNEVEDGWSSGMAKEPWCVACWVVAVVGKVFDEFDVGKTA